jgi:hypothetical protein
VDAIAPEMPERKMRMHTATLCHRLGIGGAAALAVLLLGSLSLSGTGRGAGAQSAADTIIVDSFDDRADAIPAVGVCRDADGACTLRAAVQTANVIGTPNREITIRLSAGTYRLTRVFDGGEDEALTGDLDLHVPAVVQGMAGAGGRPATVISAAGTSDRVFDLWNPASQSINITLSHLSIRDGQGVDQGGGIRTSMRVHPRVYDSEVINNHATLKGGGLYLGWSALISNSRIAGNSTTTPVGNSDVGGGGLFLAGPGTVVVHGTAVMDNRAAGHGGGILAVSTLNMLESAATGNTAARNGGGVYARAGAAWFESSTIAGNTATLGGGIFVGEQRTFSPPAPELEFRNLTVAGNQAVAGGGGVYPS